MAAALTSSLPSTVWQGYALRPRTHEIELVHLALLEQDVTQVRGPQVEVADPATHQAHPAPDRIVGHHRTQPRVTDLRPPHPGPRRLHRRQVAPRDEAPVQLHRSGSHLEGTAAVHEAVAQGTATSDVEGVEAQLGKLHAVEVIETGEYLGT